MIVSADSALLLLRKWRDERTRLKAFLVTGDGVFTVRMMGFITTLSSNGGILLCDSLSEVADHYIQIDPSTSVQFDYLEAKDLKQQPEEIRRYLAEHHGIAGLSLVFPSKSRITFFEQKEA